MPGFGKIVKFLSETLCLALLCTTLAMTQEMEICLNVSAISMCWLCQYFELNKAGSAQSHEDVGGLEDSGQQAIVHMIPAGGG